MKWIWKLVFFIFFAIEASSSMMWSSGEKSQCIRCEPPECVDCFYEVWSRVKELMAETWRIIKIYWFVLKAWVEQQLQWLCPCIKYYAYQLWMNFRIFLYKLLCYLETQIAKAKCYLKKEIEDNALRKENICKPPERKTNYLNFLWSIPVVILLILLYKLMICSVIDNYGTFFIENIRDNALESWFPTQTNTTALYERDAENLEMDDTTEEISEESISMEEAGVEVYRKEEQPISMEKAAVKMYKQEEQPISMEEAAAEIYKKEEQFLNMEEEEEMEEGEINFDKIHQDPFFEP